MSLFFLDAQNCWKYKEHERFQHIRVCASVCESVCADVDVDVDACVCESVSV